MKITQTDIDELADIWNTLDLLECKIMDRHCCFPEQRRGKFAEKKQFWLRHIKTKCESISNLTDITSKNMK